MSETKKKGLFARLREGLSKTRGNMTNKVEELVKETRKIDEDFYEELEDILILSDCGVKATALYLPSRSENLFLASSMSSSSVSL